MARLQNSFAASPNDPLAPLRNPVTGAMVYNLPTDSSAIARFNGKQTCLLFFIFTPLNPILAPQIRDILRELGHVLPNNQGGGIALLRRQLRIHMGLRADQAHGA